MRDARDIYGQAVRTPGDLVPHAEAHAARRVERGRTPYENSARQAPSPTGGQAVAYVNEGRWVADCPECNAGIGVHVDAPVVVCLDCGGVSDVVVPDARARAEADRVLGRRPVVNQGWRPDREDLTDLKAENAVRGVTFVS